MRTRTDSLLSRLAAMLADPGRTDADKLALARAQVTLIVARRKAARLARSMSATVREWAQTLPDPQPDPQPRGA
jgi:hypothetical protein